MCLFVFVISGFGIYYYDEEEKKIKLINFDVISYDVSNGSYAVVRGFRFMRAQEWFITKFQFIKHYIVWADTGTHFRCNLVMGYLFEELKSLGIHGKFICLIEFL
jgi:hypothetical protein